jgi:hypothetical protein
VNQRQLMPGLKQRRDREAYSHPVCLALSSLFQDHNALRNFHFVERDAPAGPEMHLDNIPRLEWRLIKAQ